MQRARWVSFVIVVALVGAACSRSDDEKATPKPGGNDASSSTTPPSGGLAAGNFAGLEKVCGPKPSSLTLEASDTGVTATSIQVSTFSDPGFAGRPGLNQEMFDAAEAFSKWCNEKGGINGRTIDLKLRDAKLSEYQQRVIEACDEKDFMMVGGGAVFDDTGQKDRLACGLPTIAGYAVTAKAAGADLMVQPVPNPSTSFPVGDFLWLRDRFPGSEKAVGVLTGNVATTITQAKKNEEAIKGIGFDEVYSGKYNPAGETTWRPFAEAVKANGVKGLVWIGEPVNLAKFMKALQEIGYELDWVRADANHYDAALTTEGGATVDGTEVRSVFPPFLDPEQAKEHPATQAYRDLVDQYKPGGKIAYLGIQGLSAWLLFATAVRDCGADVTRDCVYAKAKDHPAWDSGGLHAPQNVKMDEPGDCFALIGVRGGQFRLEDVQATEGIYNCTPNNIVPLTGDYGSGERCPNPAFTADPKPSNCANR